MHGGDSCHRSAKLDLCDQCRLGEDQVLAFEWHGRPRGLQLVERAAQILGILGVEPGADRADIDPFVPLAASEKQAADPTARNG